MGRPLTTSFDSTYCNYSLLQEQVRGLSRSSVVRLGGCLPVTVDLHLSIGEQTSVGLSGKVGAHLASAEHTWWEII